VDQGVTGETVKKKSLEPHLRKKVLRASGACARLGMLRFAQGALASRWALPGILGLTVFSFLVFRSNLGRFDDTYNLSDNISYDLPMQMYFNERMVAGDLPLWNPYQYAGNPIIGTGQARLIYPPRLLLTLVFGLEIGQLLEVTFHLFLCVFGSYGMLRSFRFSQASSLVGAISVLLSAEFLTSFRAFNVMATLSWIPVSIFAIRLFLYRASVLRAGFLGFTFAMLVYGGYPQYGFYALHACAIVFFFGLFGFRRRIRRIAGRYALLLLFSLAVFVVLTLPQLISSSEFFAQGFRSKIGVSLEQFNPFGRISPFALIPQIYGGARPPRPQMGQWTQIQDPLQLHLLTLLVIAGFVLGWLRLRARRSQILAMLTIAIACSLLATAGVSAEWFYHHYPLGSSFRIPQRALSVLLFPCTFGLALLYAALPSLGPQARKKVPWRALMIGLLLVILVPGKQLRTESFIRMTKYIEDFRAGVQTAIPNGSDDRYDTICWFGIEPCEKSGMITRRRNLDDYEAANTFRSYLFSRLISEDLQNQGRGHVWLGGTNISLKTLGDPVAMRLLQKASVRWIMARSELWKNASLDTRQRIQNLGIATPVATVTDQTAISMLIEKVGAEKFHAVQGVLKADFSLYTVFKIDGSLPRAYLTNQIVRTTNAAESAEALHSHAELPQTVLEIPQDQTLSPGEIYGADHLMKVEFLKDDPEYVSLRSHGRGVTFLILNDKFFPGWECTIDGNSTMIFPANVMFRGVRIPGGTHEIEFRYRPRAFLATLPVAFGGYVLLLIVVAIGLLKRWRPG